MGKLFLKDVDCSVAPLILILDFHPVHTRADPFEYVLKLARILACTREHLFPIQFRAAIRSSLDQIEKSC